MRIIEDLHTHTYYSHGKNGPRDNVLRALELGLEAVAVSEPATQETPRMCCKTCGAGILSQQSQSSSSERKVPQKASPEPVVSSAVT